MNPVFEQYFQDKAEEAISVFRTFRKEDLIEDVLDSEYSLISEAFDDVDTLLNYSNSIKSHGNLTMEQCGFIASHINSIERKYKGVIDFNTVVSESQEPSYRSAIVSEAMSKGAMALIAAAIAAVVGIIAWMLGKNKSTSSSNGTVDTSKQEVAKAVAKIQETTKKATEASEALTSNLNITTNVNSDTIEQAKAIMAKVEVIEKQQEATTETDPVKEPESKMENEHAKNKKIRAQKTRETIERQIEKIKDKLNTNYIKLEQNEKKQFKVNNKFLYYFTGDTNHDVSKKELATAFGYYKNQMHVVKGFRENLSKVMDRYSLFLGDLIKKDVKLDDVTVFFYRDTVDLLKKCENDFNKYLGGTLGPFCHSNISLHETRVNEFFTGTKIKISKNKSSPNAEYRKNGIGVTNDESDFNKLVLDIVSFKTDPLNYLNIAEKAEKTEYKSKTDSQSKLLELKRHLGTLDETSHSVKSLKNFVSVMFDFLKLIRLIDMSFNLVTVDLYKFIAEYQSHITNNIVQLNNINREIELMRSREATLGDRLNRVK